MLDAVRALGLPDGWIAAGFIRNAVWDHLHGRPPSAPAGDVDVIWYDPARADPAEDRAIEAALRAMAPGVGWSVKNQARMHLRNGDAPYASATEAMRFWPETATAVAARRQGDEGLDIAAPLGLEDLMGLVLRPTPRRQAAFEERVAGKRWLETWPLLRREGPGGLRG